MGQKYHWSPFVDLGRKLGRKKQRATGFGKVKPPTPWQKIKTIRHLAEQANAQPVADALGSVYDAVIRNAVYHSDYVVRHDSLRLMKAFRVSARKKHASQVVDADEL